MTPMQRTYAIVEQSTDAQQDVIRGLLSEIDRLQAGGCARDQSTTQFCAEAVQLQEQMRHMISIDDPVVTGLVEALRYVFHERLPLGNTVSDYLYDENLGRWESINVALSAYEARVKEVEK